MQSASRKHTALIVGSPDACSTSLGTATLGEFDCEVLSVASAEAAIEHLARCAGSVDVVLAGASIEGMPAVEFAKRINVLWPMISVIVTDRSAAAEDLPVRVTVLPEAWRGLDLVVAAQRATRADRSLGGLTL